MERGLLDIRTGEPFTARERLNHREENPLVGAASGIPPRARSLITARNMTMGGTRKLTVRDYVQDGLIAMWDGIENAGLGVHDYASRKWKDLVGNNDITLDGGVFGDNALICNGSRYGGRSDDVVNAVHIELVANAKQKKRRCWIASTGQGVKTRYCGFVGWYDRGLCFGTYDTDRAISLVTPISYSFEVKSSRTYENGHLVKTDLGYSDLTIQSVRGVCVVVGGTMNNPLMCDIHSFRLYSRALAEEEIRHNYEIDRVRFNLP